MLKSCNPVRLGLVGLIALTAGVPALALDEMNLAALPKHEAPVPYAGVRNWHVTQNMGPTGVRFWVAGNRGNSTDSREILVKSVEAGSPADGVLQPYDLIIGAAVPPAAPSTQWKTAPPVKKFDADARLSIARAITWAESDAGRGDLKLLRLRDGATQTVTIKLPVMGTYSATAPYDCPKTDRIVTRAAAFMAEHMPVEGYSGLQGAHAALLLYATGNDAYLDHVRRSALRMAAGEISDAGHETWRWGNVNTFLCEYYLATGDKRVLKKIKGYADALAAGQCNPGTWGHRAVPDFIPPGYGSLNSSGVVCFLSLVLANQIGVDFDTTALERSIGFYGSYAGVGSIPYGDHPPASGPTSNGKNGMAAVAFHQLGADPAAQWFARLCASTNLVGYEGGHTGNFFNQTWGALGAALAGRENYQNFWARFNSYRDLARRWDGSFVAQPWPHTREGDLGTGNYVRKGPMWNTGGFTLSYLAGTNRLAILGRRDSVFAANPPAELKPALAQYDAKQFAQAARSADAFVEAEDARLATLAAQLVDAAQRNINSLTLTLADMDRALAGGDLYKLKFQLEAIESILDADDERLAGFRAAVDDPANAPILEAGATYHGNFGAPNWSGPLGFQVFARDMQDNHRRRGPLEDLAAKGPGGYRAMAKAALDLYPKLPLGYDTPLYERATEPEMRPTLEDVPEPVVANDGWRMGDAEEGWFKPDFDDTVWKPVIVPAKLTTGYLRRTFDGVDAGSVEALALAYGLGAGQTMVVYLNGEKVVEVRSPGWPKDHLIPLKPIARKLLRGDRNYLAVRVSPVSSNEPFWATLKARMKP